MSRIKVTDVDICSCGIPLKLLYTVNIATRRKSVNAAGSALIATFTRNLPFIRLLFLCIASKNPGAPIVNAPSRDNCVGYNGYLCPTISVNNAKSIENIFFTRNSEAVLWILLTTLLPSRTTDGIHEKSELTSTICAALHAASLPEPKAMLQSALLSASTSLTPSPVIATTSPLSLRACIILLFCSGCTLPNTVYFSAAASSSSSV